MPSQRKTLFTFYRTHKNFFKQSSMISRSGLKLGQKLGNQAKSKENLVNFLEFIFLKQSLRILLKMFVLTISRSSLELGHLGSKTRSSGQNQRKTLLTL